MEIVGIDIKSKNGIDLIYIKIDDMDFNLYLWLSNSVMNYKNMEISMLLA